MVHLETNALLQPFGYLFNFYTGLYVKRYAYFFHKGRNESTYVHK